LFGEVVAGTGKHEIVVVHAEFLAPPRVEQRGIDGSHAGDIGISLVGHVEAAGTRSFDEREALRRVAQASAVDVNDVQRRARDRGGSDYFFDRFNRRAGLDAAVTAQVSVDWQLAFGGDAKRVDDLEARGA